MMARKKDKKSRSPEDYGHKDSIVRLGQRLQKYKPHPPQVITKEKGLSPCLRITGRRAGPVPWGIADYLRSSSGSSGS